MISCVIVCVDYSDMLRITLPKNKQLLNGFVVVTTPQDSDTHKVCEENNVKCLHYNCCYCPFDKDNVADPSRMFHLSKMINQGLMYIRETFPDDWVLYLNSDIILDPKIKYLNTNKLDENVLYGSFRHLIPTKEEFLEIDGDIDFKSAYERFVDLDKENSIGLGFFQLFKKMVFYDQQYTNHEKSFDASYSDLLFMNKFEIRERLEDYSVLHLGMPGVNWYGRKSERW